MNQAARTFAFVARFVVLGLAIAFVIGLFWPGSGAFLRQRIAGHEETAAPVATAPVSYADAVAQAAPSVVNIYANKLVTEQPRQLYSDPVLQRIFSVPTGPVR